MFQGMTIGEQRTLMALAVVIAVGLGVQNFNEARRHQPISVERAAQESATVDVAAAVVTPLPQPAAVATPAVAVTPPPATPTPMPMPTPTGLRADGRLDINRATLEELDTLPGIGPVYAQAIVTHRVRLGRFRAVEDLLAVDGIGPKTLEKLRPRVVVEP